MPPLKPPPLQVLKAFAAATCSAPQGVWTGLSWKGGIFNFWFGCLCVGFFGIVDVFYDVCLLWRFFFVCIGFGWSE
ncbi:hypothetical protein M758_10G108000 [Ceratodon purpureus]|nr:hypothetical protein M758_10G108000 [Ceratodon purpureus]